MADLEELNITVEEAYKKGFEDFDFFSKLALPEIMDFPFPVHYLSIWRMLVHARTVEEKLKILRFALGLPRGFAKTTFIKILICWFIVYDYTKFVLVVCADEQLGYNLLSDIDEILGSRNMEIVYGKWSVNKAIDNKEQKTCNYRRIPRILVAVGAGSSVRGLNIKNERPDFLLFDDMQTAENARSDTESNALLEKFVGTFLKLVSPDFAQVVYIGNMYQGNCILAKLADSPQWVSLITGCILEDGTSLWPELHPVSALHESFKNDVSLGLGHIWFAEMMNQPTESKTSLLPDGTIPGCPYDATELLELNIGGFIVIDPAGMRKVSDDNVIAVNLLIDNYKPVLFETIGGILNPEQVIKTTLEKCIQYNLSVIGVESVAYQQSLIFWFNKYIHSPSLHEFDAVDLSHIRVVELSPASRHKEQRIISWIKEVLAQNYYVYGDARNQILWQALQYKLGKKDNKDDYLDSGAYGMDMIADYWEEIITASRAVQQYVPNAHVVSNNTPIPYIRNKYRG